MAGRLRPLDPARTPIDNGFYEHVGDAWWDETGPFSALHEMNPVRVDYFDRVLREHLAPAEGEPIRLVDVGCGGGLVSEALAGRGYRVTGVDLNPGAIAAARRHAGAAGVEVDYRVGSADRLPAGDASVDAVIASDVLEHLHDLDTALAEVSRVLRPGGVFAFDTINRTARSFLLMIVAAEWLLRITPRGTHNWRMFIRPTELTALLGRQGLTLVEHTGLAPARSVPAAARSYLRSRRLGGYRLAPDRSASYIGYAIRRRAR